MFDELPMKKRKCKKVDYLFACINISSFFNGFSDLHRISQLCCPNCRDHNINFLDCTHRNLMIVHISPIIKKQYENCLQFLKIIISLSIGYQLHTKISVTLEFLKVSMILDFWVCGSELSLISAKVGCPDLHFLQLCIFRCSQSLR